MIKKVKLRWGILGIITFSFCLVAMKYGPDVVHQLLNPRFTKHQITKMLTEENLQEVALQTTGTLMKDDQAMSVEYSINAKLQKDIRKMFKRGKVPYGAFVAIEPSTGKVLAMVSHGMPDENLTLRSTFPAASVFKIITAAAALEGGSLHRNSLIPFRGRNHTLYKQNLFKAGGLTPDSAARHSRLISLQDALAKSINTVFGKIGIFGLGKSSLQQAAEKFGFEQTIPFEFPVEVSNAKVPGDDYGIAEVASGFNRNTTISPLHGALIAAAVVNHGVIMEPSLISKVYDSDGELRYESTSNPLFVAMKDTTAKELKQMMHQTVLTGTSRGTFRNMKRNVVLSELFIGGKTGSLRGKNPKGRYDWFVGFAEYENKKMAFAALSIHGYYYGIKASLVAKKAIELYFQPWLQANSIESKHSHSSTLN